MAQAVAEEVVAADLEAAAVEADKISLLLESLAQGAFRVGTWAGVQQEVRLSQSQVQMPKAAGSIAEGFWHRIYPTTLAARLISRFRVERRRARQA